MRTRFAGLAHGAFEHVAHAQFARHLLHVDGSALVGEGRVTSDHEQPTNRDNAVMISSTMPSAKYSCSDRRSYSGRAAPQSTACRAEPVAASAAERAPKVAHGGRPALSSRPPPTSPERLNGPLDVLEGEAAKIVERGLQPSCRRHRARPARSQCPRLALLPPAAPRRSRHRHRGRRHRRSGRRDAGRYGTRSRVSSGWSRLASAMACWNSMAALSASTALGNSANAPSPVSLTSRPPCRASIGSNRCLRCSRRRASVPLSSRPIRRE